MAKREEFSTRRLVIGSLTGLRSFNVDRLGRLTAVVAKQIWTPGENVATCRYEEVNTTSPWSTGLVAYVNGGFITSSSTSYDPFTFAMPSALPASPSGATSTLGPSVKKRSEQDGHELVSLSCECGFYAYFDGRNDYHSNDARVTGLIEGYGKVVMGTRGFRAEKARLVALVKPRKRSFAVDADPQEAVPATWWDRVQTNYPDVPVFKNALTATAEFPLSEQIPTPETDDDFWTRSAS